MSFSSFQYTIVGYNEISETLAYRRRIVNITTEQQIVVKENDVIGLYTYYPDRGGIPYTSCDADENTDIYDRNRRSPFKWKPSDFEVGGQSYTFVDENACKIFSLEGSHRSRAINKIKSGFTVFINHQLKIRDVVFNILHNIDFRFRTFRKQDKV